MFTSRAEYRLLLREDNADLRLTPFGRELGLVGDERWERFSRKKESIALETQRLTSTWVQPGSAQALQLETNHDLSLKREYSLADLLKRPELRYTDLVMPDDPALDSQVTEQVQIQAKYAGYIDRQKDEVDRLRRSENTSLPPELDYNEIEGLSNEIKLKLSERRPETLGRASRIPGVTPAAVSLLLIYLKKRGALERLSA